LGSSIQSLEVSYFIQMTEDEGKVRRAVADMLGRESSEERQEAEGHYGNSIVLLRHHITGEEAEESLERIVARMGADERKGILRDLESLVDEHNALYMRLSKQVVVMNGGATLGSSDPVRVKVRPRAHLVQGDPASFYSRVLGRA